MAFSTPIRITLNAALGALLLLPALLQAEETERWYQVEIIVFSQNNPAYHQSELWPRDYTLPALEGSRVLQPRSAKKQAPSLLPEPFSLVAEEKLQLGAAAKRISTASDVELMLHLGWVQPGLPEEQAVAVHIYEGMQGPNSALNTASGEGTSPLPRLDGTLRLILSRYLHLESDLMWREPLPEAALNMPLPGEGETAAAGDSASGLDSEAPLTPSGEEVEASPVEQSANYQLYRLEQSRRMRSGEVHYIDHPLFGIIAVVNRYEPPQP